MESIKEFPRGILDQAISLKAHDGECERAPDPGFKLDVPAPAGPSVKQQATSYKLPGPRPISNANKGLIHKRQAAGVKLSNQPGRASSDKL